MGNSITSDDQMSKSVVPNPIAGVGNRCGGSL
jgi:hypothetical protein